MQDFKNEQLDWDDLRLVLAIARAGSLVDAAAALDTSHPTVFRRARRLEARLGVRLFERSRRGYTLTPAGDEIVSVAQEVAQRVDSLLHRIAGRDLQPSGTIRLATVDTLVAGPLLPLLARFRQRHPEIVLEVAVGGSMVNLSRREADVALRAGGEPPAHLVGRKLARIAVAPYRARKMRPLSAADLATVPWLAPDDSLSHLASARWLESKGWAKQSPLRANSLLTLLQATRQGMGVAMLPCYLADEDRMLARVAAPVPELASDLWLLVQPELTKTTRIRAFMDAMYEEVKALRPLFEGKRAGLAGS